jgi:DNA-binding NtrC family response regulator
VPTRKSKGLKMNVLLVEDEVELRECLASALDYQGLNVIQAANGYEALEILKGQVPGFFDVLCTDFNMPFKDGVSLIIEAERVNLNAKVVILFSGKGIYEPAITDLLNRDLNCFIYFLEKPFDLDYFEQLMEKARIKAKSRTSNKVF